MPSADRDQTLAAIMKMLILALGGALVLLHVSLALSSGTLTPMPVHIATAVIGAAIAVLSLSLTSKAAALTVPVAPPAPVRAPDPEPSPVPAVPVAPASTPVVVLTRSDAPRAEAEIVAFLALLQEKGRLVDFLREDVVGATDEQVGTAARVVHAGCRSVLNDYFEITPVRSEPEGSKITLSAGYDRAAHRLLGSVAAQPPYTGTLLHPGWAVRAIKLPRVTGSSSEHPWPVLAPAEIQVASS